MAPTLPLADADAGRIRQVIGNLLTNAHLYTPEGGRIHIGAEADRAWVRIVVADSGVGMTPEETERVFERFYRAPSGTAAAPGTGLGLSIVQSLVTLHGGEVDVASRPGAGTTFQVRLPAARPVTGDAREVLRGRRVLVAAAAPTAEAIDAALTVCEADSEPAADAETAFSILASEHHDVLVLELAGTGESALEIARRVRVHPELHSTPVVFLTDGNDGRLAGEWTVDAACDPRELRAVLATALRAGRSRVLIVGREAVQAALEPALDDLGIEYHWEFSGAAAARVCGERRFELALVDAGMRNPEAALQALALRGRRLQHAVIVFGDGTVDGTEAVALQDTPAAVLAALRGDRVAATNGRRPDGAHRPV